MFGLAGRMVGSAGTAIGGMVGSATGSQAAQNARATTLPSSPQVPVTNPGQAPQIPVGSGAPQGGYQPYQGASNPYLSQQADTLTQRSNQQLFNQTLPGINSGAMAAGGFGGSRQGIAQGLAIQGQQQALGDSLASLYSNAYNTDNQLANQFNMNAANNATSMRGQDLNYNLGMTQNATTQRGQDYNYNLGVMQNDTTRNGQNLNYNLGMTNANNTAQGQMYNFYTNNRQLDQSGQRLGMDMTLAANGLALGQGQGIYNIGNTAQNAAWNPYQNFNTVGTPYTGYSTTTNTNNSAGAGFLGGALGAGQMYNIWNRNTNNVQG